MEYVNQLRRWYWRRDRIRQLAAEGHTQAAIGRIMKISRQRVNVLLKAATGSAKKRARNET